MASADATGLQWDSLEFEDIAALLQRLRTAGQPVLTGFLDTHQWVPLLSMAGMKLDGGYPAAQFRRLADSESQATCSYWKFDLPGVKEPVRTPRQLRRILGGAGIAAWQIGDIVLGSYAMLAADPALDLPQLGFPAEAIPHWDPPEIPLARATAASARTDAVIASLFHVSREEAQTAVKYGFVFRNFQELGKRTQELHAGDVLVYRTKGKAELAGLTLNPRSKRLWVDYRLYPT